MAAPATFHLKPMQISTRTQLLIGPDIEPVSLDEAKAHLRVTHSEEDSVIDGLITAARITVETITRRSLITQTWQLTLDDFPAGSVIKLPHAPVISLMSVGYVDENGNEQTLANSKFWLDSKSAPAKLILRDGEVYPLTQSGRPNCVTIEYQAGYGDQASDVPAPIRHAIKLMVAHLFENPEVVSAGQLTVIPMSLDYLLAPYRVITFF